MWTSAAQWISARRFALTSAFVFAVMCVHTWNGDWVGDFWEHSAVIRELQTHPLHPTHPLVRSAAPHQFFSPYALLVALWSRLLRVDAVTALALTGLVNFALLLYGLKRLIVALVPEFPDAPFYALVLMLFLWGPGVWFFSGVFQIGVLGYVLPYPSTFAAAVSFLVLAHDATAPRDVRAFAIESIAGAVVLVTHPPTFAFLLAGLAGLAVRRGAEPRAIAFAAVVVGVSIASALVWPYFPIARVILSATTFDRSNEPLYRAVFGPTWPALVGIPLLVVVAPPLRRTVAMTISLLLVPYVYGAISGHFSYGRVLPYIVVALQFVIAGVLAFVECRWRDQDPGRHTWLMLPAAVFVTLLLWAGSPIAGMLRYTRHREPASARYTFLSQRVGQYDVVLADPETSLVVPTFGGKTVAVDRPLLFVPDGAARRADVERFLASDDQLQRQDILDRYAVNYVLIAKNSQKRFETSSLLTDGGDVTFENREYALVSVPHPLR